MQHTNTGTENAYSPSCQLRCSEQKEKKRRKHTSHCSIIMCCMCEQYRIVNYRVCILIDIYSLYSLYVYLTIECLQFYFDTRIIPLIAKQKTIKKTIVCRLNISTIPHHISEYPKTQCKYSQVSAIINISITIFFLLLSSSHNYILYLSLLLSLFYPRIAISCIY